MVRKTTAGNDIDTIRALDKWPWRKTNRWMSFGNDRRFRPSHVSFNHPLSVVVRLRKKKVAQSLTNRISSLVIRERRDAREHERRKAIWSRSLAYNQRCWGRRRRWGSCWRVASFYSAQAFYSILLSVADPSSLLGSIITPPCILRSSFSLPRLSVFPSPLAFSFNLIKTRETGDESQVDRIIRRRGESQWRVAWYLKNNIICLLWEIIYISATNKYIDMYIRKTI